MASSLQTAFLDFMERIYVISLRFIKDISLKAMTLVQYHLGIGLAITSYGIFRLLKMTLIHLLWNCIQAKFSYIAINLYIIYSSANILEITFESTIIFLRCVVTLLIKPFKVECIYHLIYSLFSMENILVTLWPTCFCTTEPDPQWTHAVGGNWFLNVKRVLFYS